MEERDVTIPAIDDLFRKDDYQPEQVKEAKGEPKQPITPLEKLKDEVCDVVNDYVLTSSLNEVDAWNLKEELCETIQKWWKDQNTNS